MATQMKTTKPRTFHLNAPEARSVLLAGDFTEWQRAAIPMHRRNGGQWSATVAITPGEHHYRFIVDGQWRDDPECPLRAPNPFGSQDMVADVA
jgi:1,4-alpha-glucan branching enzyme